MSFQCENESTSQVDSRLFRQVLSRFGTGVTILTTRMKTKIYGMTANAFMSGSLDPPLIVVSIGLQTTFHDQLTVSGLLGISVLGVEQEHHSRHFSGRPCQPIHPRFEFHDEVPVIGNALATVGSRIIARHPCGDHNLFIGRVESVRCREGSPLLFFNGSYQELAGAKQRNEAIGAELEWHRSWW